MLTFNSDTPFAKYYNQKIHEFLATEFYDEMSALQDSGDFDLADELSPFCANFHFLYEDLDKCKKVALDLYNWSDDYLPHYLDPLHELMLYNFLNYIAKWQRDDGYIDEIYFSGDQEVVQIEKLWQRLDADTQEIFSSQEQLTSYVQNVDNLIGECFEDIDFITFPELICHGILEGQDLPKDLVDYYIELLPKDTLERFYREYNVAKPNHDPSLFEQIEGTLEWVEHTLKYGYAYKMFWADGKPLGESCAHNYLRTVFESHFLDSEVQVDHEVEIGTGQIDFRLTQGAKEKVIIEVKMGSNPKLQQGLEKQLPHYMAAEKCNQAFYVIFCQTEAEIKRAEQAVKDLPPVLSRQIRVKVFDATKKTSASRL